MKWEVGSLAGTDFNSLRPQPSPPREAATTTELVHLWPCKTFFLPCELSSSGFAKTSFWHSAGCGRSAQLSRVVTRAAVTGARTAARAVHRLTDWDRPQFKIPSTNCCQLNDLRRAGSERSARYPHPQPAASSTSGGPSVLGLAWDQAGRDKKWSASYNHYTLEMLCGDLDKIINFSTKKWMIQSSALVKLNCIIWSD